MRIKREMRLHPKIQKRAYGTKTIPELKLSGLWLEAVGFKAGSKVVIEVRAGELLIKPVSDER